MINLPHLATHMSRTTNYTGVTVLGLGLVLSQNCLKIKCSQGCLHHNRSSKFARTCRNLSFSVKCYSSEICLSTPAKLTSQVFRAVFFGSDDFSLESLKALSEELKGGLLSRLEVVSSAKSKNNPVQKFASEQRLKLHNWPPQIVDGEFDIGLVVSFVVY